MSEEKQSKPKRSRLMTVGIVSLATMLSRVLGLTRDMVFGALFTREQTDAYSIAFTIPNLLRRLLAEGILSTAFIPVFSGYTDVEKEEQKKIFGAVFTSFFLSLLGVVLFGFFLTPWVVKLFAPGFQGEKLVLTTYLLRILFPFIFLIGLTSFWVAILHTRNHFTMPALGPVLLNVGTIAGAIGLREFFPGSYTIAAMACGALFGAVLQLLLQVHTLHRQGVRFWPRWQPTHPAIREIVHLMIPTLLGLGVYQFNLLVSRALSSFLPTGSVTYLYYSDRLMELPLGVIAVAFATVNLPALTKKADAEDWDSFVEILRFGLRGVLFVCIPAGFGLFVLREQIITVMFQRGLFTYQDTLACAQVFAPAAFGLFFVAALRNLSPAFYAMKDTKTPVKIAGIVLFVNAVLSVVLAFLVPWASFGVSAAVGLTLANASSALFSVFLSLHFLNKKIPLVGFSEFKPFLFRLIWAGGIMMLFLWPFTWVFDWNTWSSITRTFALAGLVAIGGFLYIGVTVYFKIPEVEMVLRRLKRFRRKKS